MKSLQAKETWITGAVLCTQNDRREVLRANLRLQGNTIVEIRRSTPSRLSKNTKVIAASGLTIFPGFIQTHIHLCQTLFRNMADDLELLDWLSKRIWKFEAAHTFKTLKVSALLGIHELLASGTTCILDMGTVRHTEAIFEAVSESGIRANVGKCLMDHPKYVPASLREKTDAALREAIVLFKKWNGQENGRIRASFAPRFAISCTEDLLRRVAQVSQDLDAIVHTHASENRQEIELVRKISRLENIEYFRELGLTSKRLVLAHCVWLNSKEKKILAQDKVNIAHCPSSNLKLASGIADIPNLISSGINVSLGADGAPCNNSLNALAEMKLAGLIQKPKYGPKVLPAPEVLDLATRNGARALNWDQEIGSIEVGKHADLAAFNLNSFDNAVSDPLRLESIASSLIYSSQPRHLSWSMVDGVVVFKDGKVQKMNAAQLQRDLLLARKKIMNRSKLS